MSPTPKQLEVSRREVAGARPPLPATRLFFTLQFHAKPTQNPRKTHAVFFSSGFSKREVAGGAPPLAAARLFFYPPIPHKTHAKPT